MPTITVRRLPYSLSTNSVGTDGLNALYGIPGILQPTIASESELDATLSYDWDTEDGMFDRIDVHLELFGLSRDI